MKILVFYTDHLNCMTILGSQFYVQSILLLSLVVIVIIIRLHHNTMYVDTAYCYTAWSVDLSVTIVSPAKTAELIEMGYGLRWAQGIMYQMGSRSSM